MTDDANDPGAPTDERVLVPLSAEECRRLVPREGIGRVVFVDTRGPVALPVNYVVDRGDFVFRTEVWSSLLASTSSGRVSFEVDEIDVQQRLAWSVLATGTVSRVDDPAELRHAMLLHPTPWARGARDQYLRLTVKTITGRRLVRDDGAGS